VARHRPAGVARPRDAVLLCTAVLGGIVGCTVERPGDLTTRPWSCEVETDCLDGWGCADGNVLGSDFCRPSCEPGQPSSCEGGICTRTGECLARCTILGDATSACPTGQSCIRTDLLGSEGLCFPTESCSRADECEEGTRCFNDAFGLPPAIPGVEYASDHLWCVAVPDASDRCATGYLLVPSIGDETESFCLPRCDSDGSRCPPSTTCLARLGFLFGQPATSPCYPGYWGLPCDDDAQCILGSCRDVGAGRRACTFTCEEADRTFGQVGTGCAVLEESAGALRLDALTYACEDVVGERVCVPRGRAGASCNADMLCAAGLECRAFRAGDGNVLTFCSRDCATDAECDTAGAPATAFCQVDAGEGSCVPRRYVGGPCARAEQCRPGLTCDGTMCVMGT
jgi:hypothetical protein